MMDVNEIFPKMANGAHHGVGHEPPERAKRTKFHRLAKILEEGDILRRLHPVEDAIDDLDAAGRSDPARRAFAAAFDRAKLHREARHFRHVDGIVEDDEATVAEEPVDRR
jgi:hypothetical protein